MPRGPLPVIIPLAALAMVAAIGIPIGLLFLETHHLWSEDVTLVVAVSLTALIMIVATILSATWARNPEPARTGRDRSAGARDRIVRPDHDE